MRAHRTMVWATLVHAALAACSSSSTGNPEPEPEVAPDFDRAAMIAHLADDVIVPTVEVARARIVELRDRSIAWRDVVVAGGDGAAERASAQDAWRAAHAAWSEVDVMQVGPAGVAGVTKGGQGLRDEVYAWPSISACSVDQALVSNTFEDAGYFATKLVNMRGLGGAEVVLFATSPSNACPAAAGINTNGTWAALGDVEITRRRARYAAAVTAFVVERVDALLAAWSGGHRAEFVAESGGLYGETRAVIDELVSAMMYLDQQTKDQKLAVPLGIHTLCAADACPEALEAQSARAAQAGVVGNLKGIRALFTGARDGGEDGPGLEDYLVAAEATDLASRMATHIDAAIAAAEAQPGDWVTLLASNKPALVGVHDAVKVVTDDLKNEMVIVLDVELPDNVSGDND